MTLYFFRYETMDLHEYEVTMTRTSVEFFIGVPGYARLHTPLSPDGVVFYPQSVWGWEFAYSRNKENLLQGIEERLASEVARLRELSTYLAGFKAMRGTL